MFKLKLILYVFVFLFNSRKLFLYDIATIEVPIALYITIFDNQAFDYGLLAVIALLAFRMLIRYKESFFDVHSRLASLKREPETEVNLNHKVVKLSISVFRSTVVVITSIAILAVDFPVFPQKNTKTDKYGFGLMDVGVGYFIICHSMRLIRNSSRTEIDSQSSEYSLRGQKMNYI
jgi:phosphatidylinositol glycan class W